MTRFFAVLSLFLSLGAGSSQAADARPWEPVLAEAEGQTVYFNAWGGDEAINGYIAWVGDALQDRFGITLKHVKLADTAEAVTRVLAEKTAGRQEGGSIDLIWINGENFASMKEQDLLFGPFVEAAEFRPCGRRRQTDHGSRLHLAHRRYGGAMGHGAVRVLSRYGASA